MPAGDLRHRVTLEQRVQAADDGVGLTTTYAPVATVWAAIRGVRGAMYVERVQVGEGATHSIRIRYRDPAGFDHVSEGARRWRVRSALDRDGDRRWLEIMAEELTPA